MLHASINVIFMFQTAINVVFMLQTAIKELPELKDCITLRATNGVHIKN